MMKLKIKKSSGWILAFVMYFFFSSGIFSQVKIYPVTGWDLIFSGADVETDINGQVQGVNTNMRFTGFLNFSQNWHFDFTDVFGMYTGFGFRNVGLIIDDPTYNDKPGTDYSKVKRRSYNFGIPVAVKLGNVTNGMYFFAGGEIELLFHYKEKYWVDGVKYKSKEWFSDKTERWAPSVFAGLHLPMGFNVTYRYYFNNFLNNNYQDDYTDFTSLTQSTIWYVSLGWQFRTFVPHRNMNKEYYKIVLK